MSYTEQFQSAFPVMLVIDPNSTASQIEDSITDIASVNLGSMDGFMGTLTALNVAMMVVASWPGVRAGHIEQS